MNFDEPTDIKILQLINRVEQLDSDIKRLRSDFEDHSSNEALKVEMLNATLVTIQVKLDQLLIEIKEPMETYKTAKYGVSFLKWIGDTAKWLIPLAIALTLGYSAMDGLKIKTELPQLEQKEKQ